MRSWDIQRRVPCCVVGDAQNAAALRVSQRTRVWRISSAATGHTLRDHISGAPGRATPIRRLRAPDRAWLPRMSGRAPPHVASVLPHAKSTVLRGCQYRRLQDVGQKFYCSNWPLALTRQALTAIYLIAKRKRGGKHRGAPLLLCLFMPNAKHPGDAPWLRRPTGATCGAL